jgi:hypothetical protein
VSAGSRDSRMQSELYFFREAGKPPTKKYIPDFVLKSCSTIVHFPFVLSWSKVGAKQRVEVIIRTNSAVVSGKQRPYAGSMKHRVRAISEMPVSCGSRGFH